MDKEAASDSTTLLPEKMADWSVEKILSLGLLIHVICALFSSGFHHFDEHFQILEFLHFRLGYTETSQGLPWEYSHQLRSWLQPVLYLIPYKILMMLDASPLLIATILRLISSLFGWYCLCHFFRSYTESDKNVNAKILAFFLSMFWCLPYIQVRTSGENFSLSFFILGLSLVLRPENRSLAKTFISGLFFGFAFLAKFPVGVMVLFATLWFAYKKQLSFKEFFVNQVGVFSAIGLGILIDFWGYEQWAVSFWNYFKFNILTGGSARFGVTPFWDYFRLTILRGIPPLSLALVALWLVFWKKQYLNLLTWISLPYFLVHSWIGHKELRFLFPMILLTPFIVELLLRNYKPGKFYKFLLWQNIIMLMVVSIKPANKAMTFYTEMEKLYQKGERKLYVVGENPFTMLSLPLNFYGYNKWNFVKLNSTEEVEQVQDSQFLLFNKNKEPYLEMIKNKNCELKFLSYPRWALDKEIKFIKMSRVWSLFKCRRDV